MPKHTKYGQLSWSKCYSLSYQICSAFMVKVLQPVIPSMASLHGQSTTACHIKYGQPSWSKFYSLLYQVGSAFMVKVLQPVIPSMTSWAKCYSLSWSKCYSLLYQVWSTFMVKVLQPCHTKYDFMVKVLQPVIPSMVSRHGQNTAACYTKYGQPSWSKCYSTVIPSMTSWSKCCSLPYQV